MHIFTKTVKRIFLPCLIIGIASNQINARQQDSVSTTVQDSLNKKTSNSRLQVSGVIKDAASGKGLDGINVALPGYSASITNASGEFKLSIPDYHVTLLVSAPGFHTKEIALKGRKRVSTDLYEEDFTSAYDEARMPYEQKLYSHSTAGIKSLGVSDNWQRSGESVDTYLQGKVAGLNAIRRSGSYGSGSNILIRGYNSLYTTNQPLYIVDGIYYDNTNFGTSLIAGHVDNPLTNIDLKDIDNITVIKDGTASSYGTKAANGVVIITTARAKEQATKIDFAAYGGYNVKPSGVPVMDAGQYRSYLTDALASVYPQSYIQSQPYMNDDSNPATNPNFFRYHNNVNWQDQVTSNSYNQNYYMKVTGGDNIATYGLAVGYLNNKGVTNNTDLQRYQTRFNADLRLSEKFKANANLSYISNEQNLKDQGLAFNTNPLYLALTKAPFLSTNEVSDEGAVSPNYAAVDIFGKSNPVSVSEKMLGDHKNYRFMGSMAFGYEFSKKLNLQVLGGVTFSKVRENIFIPEKGVVADTLTKAIAENRSGTNTERLYSIFNDTRLSFNQTFNNIHSLSTNVGFRFNDSKMETDLGLGYNSATDEFISVGNGQAALRKISGQNGNWRSLNLYGNADYAFRKKYFTSFNIGVDKSSRFGKDAPSFALMPSLSAGWLISSEDFLAENKFFELLKLRASYGLVGNDDLGNYSSRQYYVSQNLLGFQGLVRGNVPNSSLQWETVGKFNVGVDASVLKERLSLSFDVFKNHTYDMLIQEPVPTISGFDYTLTNNGGMKSSGIELGINARVLNKAVKLDMGFNIATYRNEITKVPNDRILTNYAGATILSQTGLAANLFYGYKTNGVYSSQAEASASGLFNKDLAGNIVAVQAGDMRFVNTYDSPADIANNIHVIDENDRQVIGNPNPDFTGMFNSSLSWKRLSADIMFTFSKGNDIYNSLRSSLESMDGIENQLPAVNNRWRADGQVTSVPRAVIGDPTGNARFSDRWIEDGSYLRLRALSVSYDVPMKARALKYTKVYLTGNNLFTVTKYLGYDPEFSAGERIFTQGIDTGLEPQFKTIQLGVRVGL